MSQLAVQMRSGNLVVLIFVGFVCIYTLAQETDTPKVRTKFILNSCFLNATLTRYWQVKAPDRLEEFTTTRNEAEKLKAKWATSKKNEARRFLVPNLWAMATR
jgi:hypothetical protein